MSEKDADYQKYFEELKEYLNENSLVSENYRLQQTIKAYQRLIKYFMVKYVGLELDVRDEEVIELADVHDMDVTVHDDGLGVSIKMTEVPKNDTNQAQQSQKIEVVEAEGTYLESLYKCDENVLKN